MALSSLTGALALLAADAGHPVMANTVGFVLENDLFYNTDRNYTNGLEIFWVPGGDARPDWLTQLARGVPWFPQQGLVRHSYALGQSMFTPHDITLEDPSLDDRPYAGWLYGSAGLGVATGPQLDWFTLTLGMVGPASLAEESHKFFHRMIRDDTPKGWDTQVENEPGIVLTYQRSWRGLANTRAAGRELDLTPHVGGAFGNVFTYANAGLTLRYGKHLPLDYGPPRIQPSLPGSAVFVPPDDFEWYLFAGIESRAVARNIFLDGNTFRDSRSVEKEPLVGDLQLGIVLDWPAARVSYTNVVRTREFESQSENSDDFGALTLSVSFPD